MKLNCSLVRRYSKEWLNGSNVSSQLKIKKIVRGKDCRVVHLILFDVCIKPPSFVMLYMLLKHWWNLFSWFSPFLLLAWIGIGLVQSFSDCIIIKLFEIVCPIHIIIYLDLSHPEVAVLSICIALQITIANHDLFNSGSSYTVTSLSSPMQLLSWSLDMV